jgi:hypothetical protein
MAMALQMPPLYYPEEGFGRGALPLILLWERREQVLSGYSLVKGGLFRFFFAQEGSLIPWLFLLPVIKARLGRLYIGV